jgi:hypothetical protein
MLHRTALITILLLVLVVMDALGLLLAFSAMSSTAILPGARPIPARLLISSDKRAASSVTADMPLPPAPNGDTFTAPSRDQSCRSLPLPTAPVSTPEIAPGLERIVANGASGPGGLDAVLVGSSWQAGRAATVAALSRSTNLTGIIPTVGDPPG